MVDYLRGRKAIPEIETRPQEAGVLGRFGTGPGLPPEGLMQLSPDAGMDTFGHELTHAAETQMEQQARERDASPQFKDAYVKLRMDGGTAKSLLNMAPDKWWRQQRPYRASDEEIPAKAIGHMIVPGRGESKPPLHLDPTAATEQQILMDLAARASKQLRQK